VLNILIALLRALFDTVSKTIVATHVDESHRSYAFGLRYVVVNLAAALGPLLGTRYAAEHSMYLFHQIAYCYFFTSFGFLLCCSKKQSLDSSKKLSFPNNSSLRGTFQLIVANPSLKRLFLISFICYGLYSQITSSLAQYIMKQFADGVEIYSNLLILNAITCVVLQIFIGPLLKRVSYMLLAAIGLALMALGFLGFCFAQNSFMLSCSMLILSIGEVIFFPLNDVILAKIAPAHLIGSCYGVLNASTMGLAVGPILGGAIYQLGDYSVFIICAMISLCTIILYKKLVLAHP
jgi:MFS family permease